MRAHAGAQHLGRPERRRALERDHLAEAEGRGAAQDRADVAGVLDAVEDDARRVAAPIAGDAGSGTTKAIGAGVSSALSSAIAASATTTVAAAASASGAGAARCHALSLTSACRAGAPPPRRPRPGRDARPRAGAGRACRYSPGSSRQLAQANEQRVVARGDVGELVAGHLAPPQNSRSMTLAHRREAAPVVLAGAVLAQRGEMLGRRVALVAVEAVLRMLLVQRGAAGGRGAPWR